MVRTPHFPCWGAGVESLVRELRSHKLSYANKRIGGHKVTEMPNFCFFVFLVSATVSLLDSGQKWIENVINILQRALKTKAEMKLLTLP